MEKNDYSQFRKINIKNELPIFFIGNIFCGMGNDILEFLDGIGVKTLEDLFKAYDNGYFNDITKKYNVEIKGQIELLMAYYMGTPLIAENVLEETININSLVSINEFYINNEITYALMKIGITDEERYIIYNYCMTKNERLVTDGNGNITIMDIIKSFITDKEYQSAIIAAAYSENYLRLIQNIIFKAKIFEEYLYRITTKNIIRKKD